MEARNIQKFTPRKTRIVKNAEKLNGKRDMRKKPVKSTSVGSDLKRRIVKKQQGGVASYINVNEPVLQYNNNGWIPMQDVFSEYNLPTKIKPHNEEPLPIAIKAVDTKADSERKPVKQNAFINGLRPIIEQTLKRRGLDTKWTDHLVAQAALESGWGKSESGKFNLSGIKGKGSEKNTKEYINGKMVNTRDSFRDYKDYNDWADNYINLLSNKRYGKAWTLSEDQFMPYIINAGYATDPNYINKYNKVLAEVKKYENGGRIRRFQPGGTMNGLSPISFWNWFKNKPTKNEKQESLAIESKVPIKKSIHADRIKSSDRFDGRVNWDNIDWLQQFFTKNLGYKTATSINSSIVEEGLGNPKRKQVGGPGYGLLQWEKGTDRYNRMMQYKSDSIINGIDPELQRQAEFIINTTLDNQHKDDWTHGGRGSGYSTGEEARKRFISRNSSIQDKTRAFSLGYVRPKAGVEAANKRVQLSYSLDSIYNPRFFPSHENGGTIKRFEGGGKTIKEHPETKDIYKFYSKWLSNPKYAERIDEQGFYEDKGKDVAKARQKALDNTTVEKFFWINNYYKNDKIVLPTILDLIADNVPAHEVGHVLGTYNPTSPIAEKAKLSDEEVKYIISHMKGFDPDYISKKELDEQLGYFGAYDQARYDRAVKLEKLYNNPSLTKNDSYYLSSPSEAKANLQAFRYWLYKNGIYDINSGELFTKELLDKARQKGKLDASSKRLLETFEDDKLINLMNTLASNNQTIGNIQYTKLGGRLIKKRF